MRILDVNGRITAISRIHSGSDDNTGNNSMQRSTKYIINGLPTEVPMISGNSIRGILRRMIMQDLVDLVGYEPADIKGQVKLYHSLFSGGTLESVTEKDSGYIDLALKAEMRKTLPPLALLGMAIRNQMIEGKLDVSDMIPCCKELATLLREPDKALIEIGDAQYQTFGTRRDEMSADAKAEGEGSSQMLYTYWYMPPGTEFEHSFTLRSPSDIEISCLGRMIDLWMARPRVGGMAASGNGVIRLDYPNKPDATPYLGYVADHTDEIVAMLRRLEAGM